MRGGGFAVPDAISTPLHRQLFKAEPCKERRTSASRAMHGHTDGIGGRQLRVEGSRSSRALCTAYSEDVHVLAKKMV